MEFSPITSAPTFAPTPQVSAHLIGMSFIPGAKRGYGLRACSEGLSGDHTEVEFDIIPDQSITCIFMASKL